MSDLVRRFVASSALIMITMPVLSSCNNTPIGDAFVPTVGDVEPDVATCKPAKDPLNPLIVEWPGTNKVALDTASKRGLVVVSYAGCVLKVLPNCQASGGYDLTSVTPVRDKIAMRNENDLYARMPLAVATLKGELATAAHLDLDYVALGQRAAKNPPTALAGDCEGATHYVRTIMVGAYSLEAVGRVSVGGGVDAPIAGGGIDHKEEVRRLRGSGDVEACEKSPEGPSCNAILQVGLAPLALTDGRVATAGFGEGLGALAIVPDVPQITGAPSDTSFQKTDVALLEALQVARRADKSNRPPGEKAAAWDDLASYAGDNPYRELAIKRRDAWDRAADAEIRRHEQVVKVCAQHQKDQAKLSQLLKLDDDVVTPKQKTAYTAELKQVYAPFASVLADCGKAQVARADSWLATPPFFAKLRDPLQLRTSNKSRQLLVTDIQGLEVLFADTKKDSPDRPQLARRLAHAYLSLEAVAAREQAEAEIKASDAARQKNASAEQREKDGAKKAGQVVSAARKSAIKYFHLLRTNYPKYCSRPNATDPALSAGCGDEVLYYLALEYELAGDLDNARKVYFSLVDEWRKSPLRSATYFAFGELFQAEAVGDPAKLEFALQSYEEAQKQAGSGERLIPAIAYRIAGIRARMDDWPAALAGIRKAIELSAQASGESASQLAAIARRDAVVMFARAGKGSAAYDWFAPISGDPSGRHEAHHKLLEQVAREMLRRGDLVSAIDVYLGLFERETSCPSVRLVDRFIGSWSGDATVLTRAKARMAESTSLADARAKCAK